MGVAMDGGMVHILEEGWKELKAGCVYEQRAFGNSQRAKDLRTEAGYFENNKRRMHYLELREEGYPIGSGMIESGIKQFKARFTGPGMRWSREGIERLIPIRAAILSQQFDTIWSSATIRLKTETHPNTGGGYLGVSSRCVIIQIVDWIVWEAMMSRIQWQERIIFDPDLHHGDPCIKGTRIPVATVIGSLADGLPPVEVQQAYPQLTLEDIQAALAYAAQILRQEIFIPLPA